MMIRRSAVFSEDKLHRFELGRIWDERKGLALFIGQNPSKAGADFDDMTVTKGIGFAQRWGLGGTLHGNVQSRISTDPDFLANCVDANRPQHNEEALLRMAHRAKIVVFAWGSLPRFRAQIGKVVKLLWIFGPKCLGVTADGYPKHISRLAYATPLVDLPCLERTNG